MTPFLKWPGGKAALVDAIDRAFGGRCESLYVEPFLGGGSVYLHRASAGLVHQACLTDCNPRLVGLWSSLRAWDVFVHRLGTLPWGAGWRVEYDQIRRAFVRGDDDPIMQAARFVWLNRACFNGLYRENARGEFNSPPGDYEEIQPPMDALRAASDLVSQGIVRIERMHYRRALAVNQLHAGDQIYCDPPYFDPERFTSYSLGAWTRLDQDELMARLRDVAVNGARVVVSQPWTPRLEREWVGHGFAVAERIDVKRSIGATGDRRGKAPEILLVAGG